MPAVLSPRYPNPRLARRAFLQAGSLSFFGLTLPGLLRAREQAPPAPGPSARRVRGVILAFQTGGMSHLDTVDPKPEAPAEIRGSLNTIPPPRPALAPADTRP